MLLNEIIKIFVSINIFLCIYWKSTFHSHNVSSTGSDNSQPTNRWTANKRIYYFTIPTCILQFPLFAISCTLLRQQKYNIIGSTSFLGTFQVLRNNIAILACIPGDNYYQTYCDKKAYTQISTVLPLFRFVAQIIKSTPAVQCWQQMSAESMPPQSLSWTFTKTHTTPPPSLSPLSWNDI